MDKNYLQDVVPPAQKRSIRDIPIPSRGRKDDIKSQTSQPVYNEEMVEEITPKPPTDQNNDPFNNLNDNRPKKGGGMKKVIIAIFSILIIFVIFIVVSSFDSAVVKVVPKTESKSFDEKILMEELSNRKDNESLGYRVIELSQQLSKVAKAIDEETVQEKASGEIIIYNKYSEKPQRLIKNTRFESSSGRIYRIMESIEVPGYTEVSDGSIIAGELTATVYADEAGEDYNLSSDTFTIPGFKDQEPYEFFSAKTKTAINGGFDGTRKIVSEEDFEMAALQLKNELKDKLVAELKNEISNEFYPIYGEESFMFDNITQEPTQNGEDVQLMMRGKIVAKVFNKVDISNSLADILFTNYFTNEDTLIKDFDSLKIELVTEDKENEDTENEDKVIKTTNNYLKLSGNNIEFVWQINNNQLKQDLVGVEITSLPNIMKNYTEIKNAEASIKPFWKSKYPDNEKSIKIEISQ